MRITTPIPAILALAVLSLSALRMEGSQHRASAHKVPVETHAPKKPLKKHIPPAASKPKHSRKRHETADDTVPPTIIRIHATGHRAHHPVRQAIATAKPVERARPADFLQAATATVPVSEAASVAAPVPVVSVIRPSAETPALPSVEEAASTPVILPSLFYNKRGRLIVPRALKGSHEILLHQNEVADREGLDRVRDDEDLLDLRSQNLLVPIPTGRTLVVDERLPVDRRYCRPWTADFLATMASAYYARFHTPLQVNSAVRTVEFQQRLLRTNGNAAPAEGDTASPHLTGQAIDLAKRGLTLTEIAWLRGYLLPLVQQGKVDVEEEFQQACFHISVYSRYPPSSSIPRRGVAASHHSETTSLATAVN